MFQWVTQVSSVTSSQRMQFWAQAGMPLGWQASCIMWARLAKLCLHLHQDSGEKTWGYKWDLKAILLSRLNLARLQNPEKTENKNMNYNLTLQNPQKPARCALPTGQKHHHVHVILAARRRRSRVYWIKEPQQSPHHYPPLEFRSKYRRCFPRRWRKEERNCYQRSNRYCKRPLLLDSVWERAVLSWAT